MFHIYCFRKFLKRNVCILCEKYRKYEIFVNHNVIWDMLHVASHIIIRRMYLGSVVCTDISEGCIYLGKTLALMVTSRVLVVSGLVLCTHIFQWWIYLGKTLALMVTSRDLVISGLVLCTHVFQWWIYLGKTLPLIITSRDRLLLILVYRFQRMTLSVNSNRTWSVKVNRVILPFRRSFIDIRMGEICVGFRWKLIGMGV